LKRIILMEALYGLGARYSGGIATWYKLILYKKGEKRSLIQRGSVKAQGWVRVIEGGPRIPNGLDQRD